MKTKYCACGIDFVIMLSQNVLPYSKYCIQQIHGDVGSNHIENERVFPEQKSISRDTITLSIQCSCMRAKDCYIPSAMTQHTMYYKHGK